MEKAKVYFSLVISHFKGHSMGGFGGALKQLSNGIYKYNSKHERRLYKKL